MVRIPYVVNKQNQAKKFRIIRLLQSCIWLEGIYPELFIHYLSYCQKASKICKYRPNTTKLQIDLEFYVV